MVGGMRSDKPFTITTVSPLLLVIGHAELTKNVFEYAELTPQNAKAVKHYRPPSTPAAPAKP